MENVRIAVLTAYDKVLTYLDNTVPKAMHYYDDILHTYLKGSSYTFEFTTMTAHEDASYLVEGNKLSFLWKKRIYHLTIMNVERGGDETKVTAYGLCLELTNETIGEFKATEAMSFVQYVDSFGFEHTFDIGLNQVSNKKIKHEWTGTSTVLARLYSLANVFDAELEFIAVQDEDHSLKKLTLNIYKAHDDNGNQGLGSDKRKTILRYPNDIYGITKTSDITELYTAIKPIGTDGLTISSINGRVVYDDNGNILYQVKGGKILAPQARDRFPSTLLTDRDNAMYATESWSYETENVEMLYGQALAELKKHVNPIVTYDVDAYIDADIGDTFTIEDSEYTPTLYLEARITEQEISFTDTDKCKTIFDNFVEKESQISQSLINQMNKMIELKKVYEGSIVSTSGVLFKSSADATILTALVLDNGVDISSKYSIVWYKDDVERVTSPSIYVTASEFTEKAVYRFKAFNGSILKASAEVTLMRLQDGQKGEDGVSAYVHIAYANSSDGQVDFSLTDSNRKFIGQYSDSNQYGSEDPTKYRWSAIKGEDGQSFVSAEEQFYYSTSKTELIGGEWFVGNVVYQSDKFLWKRWKCTYANPSEIKYTKAIFDNTWNEIDAKIGEIHTQVSEANTQSKEAVEKATQAQTDATKANQLASTANTQSSEAKKLAQDANASTGKAQEQIDAIKGDITDSKKQIQDAVDKANANATEINTVKETYATKVDLTNESKSIHADVSTEIEKKVGELSASVSQTYASKSDLTSIEGSLNTKIKQNADSITAQASSIEKLQSDTTQAQLDIADATKKATDAQAQADKALGNAQSAQTLADEAKKKADSAQLNLDSANKELADAKANLETVTGRVDATEDEITKAQTRLTNAETAVQKAQTDATTAQGNAQTAINNAKTAQSTADTAKANAEQAQKDLADLTNKVTSNTTKIEQNAKQITIQASSITEVGDKVDGIQNDITNNYYSKEQTNAQIKISADKISQTVSETNKVVTSLNDRANSGEFNGRGVKSTTVEYQASTSGTTVPTGTWVTTIPAVAAGSYLWTKTTTNYTSGDPTIGYSVARMGVNGAKGDKGDTGPQGPQGIQGLKGPQGVKGATGAQGPTGPTGPQGPQGADGKSPTVSVSKSGNTTTITVNNPDGTKTSQTVKDGTNGTPGKDGATGKTTYFHVKYSNDGGKTFTSNSGETVGDYIGTYTDFVEADSTSASSYTWAKIKGPQGLKGDKGATGAQGPQGIQGPQGVQGLKGDVGPQGPQGVQGAKGADGKTYYTWIKYADSPTSGMSDSPTGKLYLGVAYNKSTATESTNYSDYSWSLIKGDKGDRGATGATGATGPQGATGATGPQGATGATGNGIKSIAYTYARTTSQTAPAASAITATTMPTLDATNKYLWQKEVITYTNNQRQTTVLLLAVYGDRGATGATGAQGPQGIQGPQGVKGDKGATGAQGPTGPQGVKGNDGKGIKSTSVTYQAWDNGTNPPPSNSGWVTTPPKTTASKPYLWTKTVLTYTDNTSSPPSYSVGATPEGIQENINNLQKTIETQYQSYVDQKSQSIEQRVAELKKETDSTSTRVSSLETNFKVSLEGFEATKTSVDKLTDAANKTVSKEDMIEYIRWNGNDLELGKKNQPFKCKLSTEELAFYQDKNKVAWISNQELNVLRAIIAESIGCGAFRFVDEGDLGFSLK